MAGVLMPPLAPDLLPFIVEGEEGEPPPSQEEVMGLLIKGMEEWIADMKAKRSKEPL